MVSAPHASVQYSTPALMNEPVWPRGAQSAFQCVYDCLPHQRTQRAHRLWPLGQLHRASAGGPSRPWPALHSPTPAAWPHYRIEGQTAGRRLGQTLEATTLLSLHLQGFERLPHPVCTRIHDTRTLGLVLMWPRLIPIAVPMGQPPCCHALHAWLSSPTAAGRGAAQGSHGALLVPGQAGAINAMAHDQ
jgi:hypothetical protein